MQGERESLVIKPNRSYGGEGVLIGLSTPQAEWEAAIERIVTSGERWVVQQLAILPVSEFPRHSVTLAPFFLDRTEVTNQQYAVFIDVTKHAAPANSFDPKGLNIWRDGRYLVELAGADRVMLGSDYPFPILDPAPLEVVRKAGLSEEATDAILSGNAPR